MSDYIAQKHLPIVNKTNEKMVSTSYEEASEQLEKAQKQFDKAKAALKKFEEGEDDGQWLKSLRRSLRRKEIDENDRQQLTRLEAKEKELKVKVNKWDEEVRKWSEKVREWRAKIREMTNTYQTGNGL